MRIFSQNNRNINLKRAYMFELFTCFYSNIETFRYNTRETVQFSMEIK